LRYTDFLIIVIYYYSILLKNATQQSPMFMFWILGVVSPNLRFSFCECISHCDLQQVVWVISHIVVWLQTTIMSILSLFKCAMYVLDYVKIWRLVRNIRRSS